MILILNLELQERMRAESQPSAQHMMLGMNFWSAVLLGAVVLINREGIEFINFVTRHPIALVHIAALAVAGAIGQLFIFLTVRLIQLINSYIFSERLCYVIKIICVKSYV